MSSPPNVAITCLSWIQASASVGNDDDEDDVFRTSSKDADVVEDGSTTPASENPLLQDDAAIFLQKLPSLAKNQGNLATKKEALPENVEDGKRIKDQKSLNVLTAGFGRNMVREARGT